MTLIYTDRSRQETDLTHCPRERYLKYHHLGFGIVRVETALELETGTYVHEIVKKILKVVQLGGGTLPLPLSDVARMQIRGFITDSLAKYQHDTRKAGIRDEKPGEVDRLIKEQSCLIEGFIWAFVKVKLPLLLQEFEIVAVEEEDAIILDCTCGSDHVGTTEEYHTKHKLMRCNGIYNASRPDIVLRRRSDGELGVHDWKTSKYMSDWEVDRYRDSVQMAMGTVGIERRLGIPVTHYYLHFFLKGDRKKSYIPELKTFEGPKTQLSHLCYTNPGNPPLTDIFDTTQKWYKKLPVWEMEMLGKPEDWTNPEYLVEALRTSVLTDLFGVIGPYGRQEHLINRYKRQLVPYERAWVRRSWEVYRRWQQGGEKLDNVLDEVVPASWDCFKFGRRCEMYEICHGEGVSVEDPIASGLYKLRVPHHEDEARVAAEARETKE